jgi:transposase
MSAITIIGVDLAKRVFQLHGAKADGSVAFRKQLSRGRFLTFLAEQPRCVVAMEACATAHGWGRGSRSWVTRSGLFRQPT